MAKKAELNTKINLDSSAFQRGIAKSKKSVSTFASTLKGSLLPVLGAAGAAGAMVSLGKEAMRSAKEIKQLAGVSGVGVEEFQKLAFAAKTVNIEQEKLADIFKDTSDKMGDFMQVGSGPMVDFFEKIAPMVGATKEEFVGLSGADALQKYFDFLQKANLPHADMVFYMEAIASDATMLIPLLENGGEAFKKLGDDAEKAGGIMGTETVDALTKAQLALDRFKNKAVIVAGTIVAAFIPATDKFKEMAKEQLIAAKQLEAETTVVMGGKSAALVKDQQAIIRNREKINKLAAELKATEEQTLADSKAANDLANEKLQTKKDEIEAAAELAKNYEKNFFIAQELEILKLKAAGDTAQADALQRRIDMTKFALELMKKHNISREEAIKLTFALHEKTEAVTEEDEDQVALKSKKLALLQAEAAQDDALTQEAKNQLALEEEIQSIMQSTNADRATAITLAQQLQKASAGADINQSGYVTPREQRDQDRKDRKATQEREKRERKERADEVGADQRKRDQDRNDRMTQREMANGIDTGNGGSGGGGKIPSGEKAKDKTDSKALEKSAEDTAKNTKDILDEIQKNP